MLHVDTSDLMLGLLAVEHEKLFPSEHFVLLYGPSTRSPYPSHLAIDDLA